MRRAPSNPLRRGCRAAAAIAWVGPGAMGAILWRRCSTSSLRVLPSTKIPFLGPSAMAFSGNKTNYWAWIGTHNRVLGNEPRKEGVFSIYSHHPYSHIHYSRPIHESRNKLQQKVLQISMDSNWIVRNKAIAASFIDRCIRRRSRFLCEMKQARIKLKKEV